MMTRLAKVWHYDPLHQQPVYLFWDQETWRARFQLCQVIWLSDDEIPTIIRALQAR
jgi:hypothetical protein